MTISRASDHVRSLEAENEKLARRVAMLEGEVSDLRLINKLPDEGVNAFGLSHTHSMIFAALLAREIVSTASLLSLLYSHRPDGGPGTPTLVVFISTLRRKLAPFGITIKVRKFDGYFIPEECKAKIRATLKQGESNAAIPTDPTLNPPAPAPRREERGVPAAPR